MKEGNPEHDPARAHTAACARHELAELAARAAQGDGSALGQLQRRLHSGLVRWFARTWPADPERNERLSNETWVEVWHALRDGRYDARRAAISTFAFAIASNLRLRELRLAGRAAHSSLDEHAAALPAPDTSEAITHASMLETVRHLLSDPAGGLEDSDRNILSCLARGMGDRDIARELGVSPSTGHERKKRALARLASLLHALGHSVHSEGSVDLTEHPQQRRANT